LNKISLSLNKEGLGLGFWPQRLILQAYIQGQKFAEVSTDTKLNVALHSIACRSHSLCFFYAVDSLNLCIIKHLHYLILTNQFDDITVHTVT